MVEERFSGELNQEIKADKTYSQIFINMSNSPVLFREVKEIVEGLDVHIIEAKTISPEWTLLKLDVKDMREVALKLTEQGFLIKGINALP